MNLTDKQITEFQQMFEKKYGKKMSRQEAEESAVNLLSFFELLYKIARRNKINLDVKKSQDSKVSTKN